MADSPPRPSDGEGRPRLPGQPGARRALGRGLGALIPGADLTPDQGVVEIPVDRIRPNTLQPRTAFGSEPLSELQASIREHGVLQPVLVRPSGEDYELVAGERRWRAAVAAGLRTVPAMVRHLDDRSALEAALVENLQREDLGPLERARAYRRLIEDFGLSQEDVARRVGRSQPSVANTLRLLSLPGEVQASLEAGRISEGHARALLTLQDQGRLLQVWRQVESRGLSVRATEVAARRAAISREIRRRRPRGISGEILIIQQSLQDRLGTPIKVDVRGKGRGEIRITFFSIEDLERLVDLLMSRREPMR
ncbi:MAG: ParB/RepB/Spo0J family partition protein [Armatimonadota bacterium]|nr:ParB/RepB/Spo0J family partition protein [Armatimonadota bacterium]